MIAGLRYVPEYLDAGEHDVILGIVSGGGWQDAGGGASSSTATGTTGPRAVSTASVICRSGRSPSPRACTMTA